MLEISSNGGAVLAAIGVQMRSLAEANGAAHDKLTRQVASDLITVMHERIHVEGKNSAGQEMGTYSSSYLKRRQAAGLSGNKVILRFEGQLEKLTIVGGSGGNYEIGWISGNNLEKAKWMEEKYGTIYQPTAEEQAHAVAVAEDFLNIYLGK